MPQTRPLLLSRLARFWLELFAPLLFDSRRTDDRKYADDASHDQNETDADEGFNWNLRQLLKDTHYTTL